MQCQGGGNLGPVEQGQPFLRLQFQRFQPQFSQEFPSGNVFSIDPRLAFAKQNHAQVCQRCKISGSSNGTLGRNAGQGIGFQKGQQVFHGFHADSGKPADQAVQFEHQDQPHHSIVQQGTGAAGMGKDEILLKFRQFVPGDLRLCQGAETGVDAVDGLLLFQYRIDSLCRSLDAAEAPRIQFHLKRSF